MSKRSPAPTDDLLLPALWTAAIAAFWLVPDQKLIRAKLLAVQAAVIVVGARLAWRSISGRETGYRTSLDFPAAALAAMGLLFWALSAGGASQTEAVRLFFCALTFWVAARSQALSTSNSFITAWSGAATLAALWALAEAAAGRARPFASFGNPIFLGTALAAALPIAVFKAVGSRSTQRAAWCTLGVIQAAALALTASRAAVLGLLAALGLWALARLHGRRLLAAIAGAGALLAAAIWVYHDREWTHALIWRDALSLWRAHPIAGCGLGRFHLEFPAFASAALKARWPEGRVVINFAHNEYLQTLVETGPLGLAALLAIPVAAWFQMKSDGAPAGRLERDAATTGALALFAAAFVSPDLRFGASAFAAFALLGIGARLTARGFAPPAALQFTVLAVFLGFAAKPALAVRRNALETPFHETTNADALGALEARVAASPSDADLAEELGYLKAKASDFDGARAAFLRATQLAPGKPGPMNNLGNLRYLAGDFDGAIDWWKKSLEAAPEQIDSRLNLAKLLCERGRLKECSRHLEEVLRRDPSNAKALVLYKKMIE